MKNKTLKHYKRKKFFYRFFMRKSPRSAECQKNVLAKTNIVSLSIIAKLARFTAKPESNFEERYVF